MSTLTDTQKIVKQNEAILRRLDEIIKSQKQWVRASVIQELTGWDGSKMKKVRRDGSLEWKKGEDGTIWYNLNSLNPLFIKKQTA